METYALFDDQSAHAISFTPLNVAAHEKVDRIQIKSFLEDDAVNSSVTKGIWAAYSILEKISLDNSSNGVGNFLRFQPKSMPLIPASKKYYIVCELDKSSLKRKVTGESAGLAFCLKFVQHVLLQQNSKYKMPAMAATGILDDRLESAKIKKVESINDKIKAALSVSKYGDYFFYPLENEKEIDDELKMALAEKQIKAIAVDSVQEAVTVYIKAVNPALISRKIKSFIFNTTIMLLIFAMASLAIVFMNKPTLEKVRSKMEHGDFEQATELLQRINNLTLEEEKLENYELISEQINMPLFAEIKFEYFTSEDASDRGKMEPLSSLSNVTFTLEDSYRFQVKPGADCYFYIFQFDSKSGAELLFPLAAFSTGNHYMQAEKKYDVPGGGNTFYLLDGTHQGTVTLYFLATVWRALDIEKAFESYQAARAVDKNKLRDKLLERLNQRIDTPDKGVNSVFVRKEYFLQK
jgi:hypothetical protein